jgi:hypothetical protein
MLKVFEPMRASSPRNIWWTSLRGSFELTREQVAALKDVRIENIGYGRKVQFRLSDKLTALIAMSRHLENSMTRAKRDRRAALDRA